MAENSKIGWTHNTFNPWMGCDKVAPECAKCYIERVLARMGKEPWGQLYRSRSTWGDPIKWERKAEAEKKCYRVFTCSLSDFFHIKADPWRPEAWELFKYTQHMVYLVLTKRPNLILNRLPPDWPQNYPNVWLGVSSGCRQTLIKMDELRKIPIHPKAVRFLSAEPLLEDISEEINFDGFGWAITGGETGSGPEYQWNAGQDWRKEFAKGGRRTMKVEWAQKLLTRVRLARLPFYFKQTTAPTPGQGADILGRMYEEFPSPPMLGWAPVE